MAGGVFGYANLNTRVRVMYSALYTPQGIASLYAVPDFPSLLANLKQSNYRPYLEIINEKDLIPRRTIFQLKERLAFDFSKIIHLVPKHAFPTLLQLYRYYEVNNLKAILRGILTGASWDRVRYVLFPYGTTTVLPAQQLLEARNVENAVELLKQTPYYASLLYAMKRFREEKSLFPVEIALDLSYWRDLWQTINKLPSEDKTHAVRIIGGLVDITNLMWAIRYREYYHLSEEELINYTLPFGYHSTQKDIRDIAAGAEISQVLARVFPDIPEADAQLSSDRRRLPELENKLKQHLVSQYRAVFVGNPFHVGISLAYLLLFEFEIQDLTILIEAKSSQVQVEDYQPYLLTLT